jgi:glutaredoxin
MKIYIQNFNSVATDIINELRDTGHNLTPLPDKADRIVVWQDVLEDNRNLVLRAKEKRIPTICISHGRLGHTQYLPPFNVKSVVDKHCVWGARDKRMLINVGIPQENIHITSSPIFKYIQPKIKHSGKNIVFIPMHWEGDVIENWETALVLRQLKGVNITTKILAGEHFPERYQNPVSSNRLDNERHFTQLVDVLRTADLVVSLTESTPELFATIMDIPIVLCDHWYPKTCRGDKRYLDFNWEQFRSIAIEKSSLENLNKTIKQVLKNPNKLKEQRKIVSIDDGGINIINPTDEICKVILQ